MGGTHNPLRQRLQQAEGTRTRPENDQKYYRRTKALRITHSQLLAALHYDLETGIFTHLKDKSRGRTGFYARKGERADHPFQAGYRRVEISGTSQFAHRVAWFYMTGTWVLGIDHKNRRRDDNSWTNLRLATRSQNNVNSKLHSRNTSRYRGVSWDKKRKCWFVTIRINGKSTYLGSAKNIEDAAKLYRDKAVEVWGDYVNFT